MYRKSYLPAIVLAIATSFFIVDIISDVLANDGDTVHLTIEFVVFLATSSVLAIELRNVKRLSRSLDKEKNKTARLAGELQVVIYQQFEAWKLSPSEKDVAILLIKGLSMKEIAAARDVKDKTVRTQAAAIYGKTRCDGRHELAAFFIEDLMNFI